jgi:hypothetical protein
VIARAQGLVIVFADSAEVARTFLSLQPCANRIGVEIAGAPRYLVSWNQAFASSGAG